MSGISAGNGTTGFQLGDAANYGIIAFDVHNFSYTSDSFLTGNLGIDTIGGSLQLGNGTITGRVDFNGSESLGSSGTVTGGIHSDVTTVGADVTALQSLSTTLHGYTGTTEDFTGGTLSFNANSGNLVNGNEVFTLTGTGIETQNG
jgi:hypothetical protein